MKRKTLSAVFLASALLAVSGLQAFAEADTENETTAETVLGDEEDTTEADTESAGTEENLTEGGAGDTDRSEEGTTEAPGEGGQASSDGDAESALPKERPEYNALDYVTVGEYKGLNVVLEPIEIAASDIESTVNGEVAARGLYQTDGVVENGDVANIDYEGKLDGVAFDGGTAEGYDLEIGSGTFIPGFEEGLVGVAVGDTVDLNLTFPENYGNTELAGQETVFTVTVNYVMPELTDDLAAQLSDGVYTTAEDYRGSIREKLEEDQRESQVNLEVMTQLYNTCQIKDYPQDVVDYSVASMENVYEELADLNGMEFEELVEAYGMTADQFHEAVVQSVKQSLQQEMILKAVAETEGLEISEEEYADGCVNYAENMGYESAEQFQEEFDRATIEMSLLMDKTLKFVRDNALIEEVEETEADTEEIEKETGTEASEDEEETSETEELSDPGETSETEELSETE